MALKWRGGSILERIRYINIIYYECHLQKLQKVAEIDQVEAAAAFEDDDDDYFEKNFKNSSEDAQKIVIEGNGLLEFDPGMPASFTIDTSEAGKKNKWTLYVV